MELTFNGKPLEITKEVTDILTQSTEPEKVLSAWIYNGYKLSECIPSINRSCGCCRELTTVTQTMTDLLEPFQTGGNSSKNGKLGEIFALNSFKKRFPNLEYRDTSGIDKSGDGILELQNHRVRKIMFEYKNYESVIPKQEIDKLLRDLKAQNIHYGIFVSYKSRISGKQCIDAEVIDGKLIVYIANFGMNALLLDMALQYLLKLDECNYLEMSQSVLSLSSKATIQIVSKTYEKMIVLTQDLTQTITYTKECQDKLNGMFYKLINQQSLLVNQMNLLLERLDEQLLEEHQESFINKHSYETLTEYIQSVVIKEKDKQFCIRILTILKQHQLSGFYSETDSSIHIHFQQIELGKLHLGKSKVQLIVPVGEGRCYYNPKYEDIKHQKIYITLQDKTEVWNIIEQRFLDKINI